MQKRKREGRDLDRLKEAVFKSTERVKLERRVISLGELYKQLLDEEEKRNVRK